MTLTLSSRRAACLAALVFTASVSFAAENTPPAGAPAGLPPLPAPAGLQKPGPKTDAPYAPLTLLPGGVVVPLFPPGSPYLKADKINEPEVYQMWSGGTQLGAIVSIHNPSIEFHRGQGQLNTGAAIILAAGGGHRTLNVGSEANPFVDFFAQHGISTIILRNRLRADGYEPRTDAVYDTLQAVKLARAYAADWKIDPAKIGVVGFSAGAELAAAAALQWEEFDQKNDVAGNPVAKISARPDFVGLIYPGPTPFTRGATPTIPRSVPPAFIAGPGWGDRVHAVWANEYFTAMLNDGVPNVEMHIYARGHHPGDRVGADEPPATGGLANMGGIAWGTWSARYLEWMRDLGFLNKPGVPTQAAKDVAAALNRPPPRAPGQGGGGTRGGAAATPAPANTPAAASAPANPK